MPYSYFLRYTMNFFVTFATVAIMLMYALPGWLLIKFKKIKPDQISAFAKMLLFALQPAQTVYSFMRVEFSWELLANIGLFFATVIILMGVLLFAVQGIIDKKNRTDQHRILNMACCFGNVSFLGIPLVEAVLPQYPHATVYCIAYSLAMNVLGWTAGAYILTGEKKYITPKKIILNPGFLSAAVAIPMFIAQVQLPERLLDGITLFGKMTTPMCMLILGMRLGTIPFKEVFGTPKQYAAVGFKQICLPLIALVIVKLLPMDEAFESALYLLCCCPVASFVLNLAEIFGKGQKTAANTSLLGTLLSIVTLPIMSILL